MKLEKNLNVYLANQGILNIKLHNLHWYVSGEGFFTTHAKFEELYNIMAEGMDEVAEVLLSSGFKPVASMKSFLEVATIAELPEEKIGSRKAIEILKADFEKMLASTKEIIAIADEEGNMPVSDLMHGYLAEYQKSLWMLNAYLG
ncbi:MAG: Dps family protein [Sarcina sp.]